jgi:hypothetical protein
VLYQLSYRQPAHRRSLGGARTHDHLFGCSPYCIRRSALGRNRTRDILFRKEAFCPLNYKGVKLGCCASREHLCDAGSVGCTRHGVSVEGQSALGVVEERLLGPRESDEPPFTPIGGEAYLQLLRVVVADDDAPVLLDVSLDGFEHRPEGVGRVVVRGLRHLDVISVYQRPAHK